MATENPKKLNSLAINRHNYIRLHMTFITINPYRSINIEFTQLLFEYFGCVRMSRNCKLNKVTEIPAVAPLQLIALKTLFEQRLFLYEFSRLGSDAIAGMHSQFQGPLGGLIKTFRIFVYPPSSPRDSQLDVSYPVKRVGWGWPERFLVLCEGIIIYKPCE